MQATYEMAERVAGYYCEERALEDELTDSDNDMMYTEHPEWDTLSEDLADKWALTDEEGELLTHVLESGLCDYFSAEDVMSVL